MKHHFLRRLGALALAFALSLSLAVVPAWALGGGTPTTGLTITAKTATGEAKTIVDGTLEMKVDEEVTLSVKPTNSTDTTEYQYLWNGGLPDELGEIEYLDKNETASSRKIKATKAGEYTLSVITGSDDAKVTPADDTGDGQPTLGVELLIKITEPTPPQVAVTGIVLNKTELTLTREGAETLIATVAPENATNKVVNWDSDKTSVATVDGGGKVTAVGVGTATITAATVDGGKTAQCVVTVVEKPAYATGISFTPNSPVQIDQKDDGGKTVTATPIPSSSNQTIEWDTAGTDKSVVTVEPRANSLYNRQALLKAVGPGETEVIVRAKSSDTGYAEETLKVIVSGIKITNPPVSLTEGGPDYYLQAEQFGEVRNASGTLSWSSSDDSTVSVGRNNGRLTALKTGTVTITATRGTYKAECKVTVVEDTSAIISMRDSYSAGKPLVIGSVQEYAIVDRSLYTLPGALDSISYKKTATMDANGQPVPGSGLSYIANVSVPTEQGTLYYHYNSEANTGAGVGITDRFYYGTAPAGRATLSDLTFVPRQGFNGTAEISFNGFAANGGNFSGMIRVPVNGTGNGGISYGTISGQPVDFQADDFNAYCRAVTGQNLNYVTFSLPAASTGVLYYNYTGPSQYSNRVSASTRYTRTGTTNIGNVSFVPSQGYMGTVSIMFQGVNTAGTSFTGTVTINVGTSSTGMDFADVSFTAADGKQATLRAGDFNDACRSVLGETLAYVRFRLPSANEGTLYYNYRGAGNYDSRVDESTRYYYSGTPGLGNITFVAAANAGGQVAIPYTGYSASGATYTGTVYINLQAESEQTIHYFVDKLGLVALQVNDFNNVCLRQTGYSMDYVTFSSLPASTMGTLYYNFRSNVTYNTRVYTGTSYWRYNSGNSSRYLLGYISFYAGSSAGTVAIPYTIYANTGTYSGTRIVRGTMLIHVGSISPADVTLSGNTAHQVWLPSYTISSVCGAVMNRDLAYIEITSVPGEKEGRVYRNYSGYGTGTEVTTGTRYYRAGSPSIDQLSFVPYGGFNGTATITYIGYSRDGVEQVSGQIKITIANSTTSRYFNDMSRHTWAVDAVDFLYVNNISNGVGNGRYSPGGTLTRGDFTLMLVRTFGLTSSSIHRYNDVPSSSYYAQAISTAKALGITVGDSGSNFYPKQAISRQDAMVMLYNAMKVSGRTMTNGLAADMSKFSDRGSIAGYAAEAVGTLVQMGVVKGDGNGRLRPTGTLTRAETAILLQYVLTL